MRSARRSLAASPPALGRATALWRANPCFPHSHMAAQTAEGGGRCTVGACQPAWGLVPSPDPRPLLGPAFMAPDPCTRQFGPRPLLGPASRPLLGPAWGLVPRSLRRGVWSHHANYLLIIRAFFSGIWWWSHHQTPRRHTGFSALPESLRDQPHRSQRFAHIPRSPLFLGRVCMCIPLSVL